MSQPLPSARVHARPLRTRLLLLASSGLVPLLLVLAWGLNYLVDERRAQVERTVLDLSRAMATAVDGELNSVIVLLEHLGVSDDLERADLRSFHQAARRTAERSGWREVTLADSEGRVLLRTGENYGASKPAPVEPRSMARVIQDQKPVVSPVVHTTDASSDAFTVRVPVLRGGKLVYVLGARLPVDLMMAVLKRQDIPDGSVAAIYDQAYYRVARSRDVPSRSPAPSLQVILERGEPQGVGRTRTLEGTESYAGYTRLPVSGWVVAVGQSVAEANEPLFALLRALALGLAGSLALAGVMAWVLSRQVVDPIDLLKDGAAALGRGEPVQLPKLAITELDDVAQALNGAALDRDHAAAQVRQALHTAEEANRSKDQFLAVLGHELRNPLAPISNAVQLMALKGDSKTEQERRIIERQLVHVTRLVDDLLDVSRITSGRLAIRREPVRLAQVLSQVVEAIRQSVFQRTLTLELGGGIGNAWVTGDEVRLVQVFNNLLVNAVKFTPTGGTILIRTAVVDGHAQVDIEDSGIGIAADDLERIFDLFYQAPQNSDRALGGLGLGLPIVKSLLQMHGGNISCASDGPGSGTRFTVTLPLCAPPLGAEEPAATTAPQGAGKVLVVDDNEDAADTCSTLLELSGYTVRTAYTPKAALDTLAEFIPDVAILDIGLPGMSGHQLARLMRAAPYDYKGALVALTGYGTAADMAASKQAGFDAHLTKPVAPSGLLELVEQMVKAHQA